MARTYSFDVLTEAVRLVNGSVCFTCADPDRTDPSAEVRCPSPRPSHPFPQGGGGFRAVRADPSPALLRMRNPSGGVNLH